MSIRPHPTAHLSKKRRQAGEKGPWWVIDVGRGDARCRNVFCGSYEAACEHERMLRLDMQAPGMVHAPTPKIKEIVIPWLEWYQNEVSPNTLRDVRSSTNKYFVPYWGNLRPGQLTVAEFNRFKTDLLERGISPTTINKNLNYFSSLLNWAVANNLCLPLPFKLPKFPKKRTNARPAQPLTRQQLDSVYEAIEQEYKLLFLLMADMGLRRDEAMHVQLTDVDRRNKTIMIHGKGNKYRYVPYMTDRFEAAITRQLQTAAQENRTTGPLILNPQTGKPYTTIRKALLRAAKKAEIGREVNHHQLRHTMATLAAEKGINPHALQRILGHESITTTNKIYTNVGQDFVGTEARKLRNQGKHLDTVSKLHLINGGNTKKYNRR